MTTTSLLLSCLLTVFAGACVAMQQVLNADLRTQLGSPWWAGAVSYFVGLVATLSVALVAPGPRFAQTFQGAVPSLSWTGGLFGATFIAIAILMLPRLGAATTLALMVVGQMFASLCIDHLGLFRVPEHPITLVRVAGVACLILGVVLVRA